MAVVMAPQEHLHYSPEMKKTTLSNIETKSQNL